LKNKSLLDSYLIFNFKA